MYAIGFMGKRREVRIMSADDARRFAAVNNLRIVAYVPVKRIGIVEVDDYYDRPIYGYVYETPNGSLMDEYANRLTKWQRDHIEPIEEDIII